MFAEVDGLAPRRGPDLHEEDVDQAESAVLHHEVRGLDVAVGEADVPHPPDHQQALLDHAVVDLRLADLARVLEELHRDQVLALRRDLDDPERGRRREAVLAEQAQRVVLVLDEPAHRGERRLVLETAVEHRPAELVPAIGTDVVLRVELREHRSLVALLVDDPQLHRRGTAGSLEPHQLHLEHGEAELLTHRPPDRITAAAAHVQMRGLAARAVAHGEHVVGDERAEQRDRDGDAEDRREHDVRRVLDPQVDPEDPHGRDGDRGRDLRAPARPAGDDEHERDPDERGRERGDRKRGRRVPLPTGDLRDVERPSSRREDVQRRPHELERGQAHQEHDEVAEAPEERRDPHRDDAEQGQPPSRPDRVHPAGERVQPSGPQRDDRTHQGGVEPVERPRREVQPERAQDDDDEGGRHPELPGDADHLRQRRRRSGRPALPLRRGQIDLDDLRRGAAGGRPGRLGRLLPFRSLDHVRLPLGHRCEVPGGRCSPSGRACQPGRRASRPLHPAGGVHGGVPARVSSSPWHHADSPGRATCAVGSARRNARSTAASTRRRRGSRRRRGGGSAPSRPGCSSSARRSCSGIRSSRPRSADSSRSPAERPFSSGWLRRSVTGSPCPLVPSDADEAASDASAGAYRRAYRLPRVRRRR